MESNRPLVQLKVWEEPVEAGLYVIGADPAYGRNEQKDRHCASIWRCYADRLCQVAEFATNDIEVKQFTWILAHLAAAYRDSILNVELEGPGRLVMQEMAHLRGWLSAEMNEKFVQSHDWENALGQARWFLYNRIDSMGKGYAANFQSTGRLTEEIMHLMRGSFMTNELDIRSVYLLYEMRLVVQDGRTIGAPDSRSEESKDDRVFAAALAVRAWADWRRQSLMSQGLTYDRVTAQENGQLSLQSESLNRQVHKFFLTLEEKAKAMPEMPTWRESRGL